MPNAIIFITKEVLKKLLKGETINKRTNIIEINVHVQIVFVAS
jgi:hypothetical protein